jgi:hypothetical protein
MTIAEFKAYFPEFTATADPQIQRALDVAVLTCSESVLGDRFDLGLKYLTAHFISINSKQFLGIGESTKSLASKSVDGVSLSYNPSHIDNDALGGMLNSTSYGQMYNRITLGFGSGGFTC